jgi:hypothetical protein
VVQPYGIHERARSSSCWPALLHPLGRPTASAPVIRLTSAADPATAGAQEKRAAHLLGSCSLREHGVEPALPCSSFSDSLWSK